METTTKVGYDLVIVIFWNRMQKNEKNIENFIVINIINTSQ